MAMSASNPVPIFHFGEAAGVRSTPSSATIGEDVLEWDATCAMDEDNPALASLAGLNPTTNELCGRGCRVSRGGDTTRTGVPTAGHGRSWPGLADGRE